MILNEFIEQSFLNVYFVPIADIRIYGSPVTSSKFDGIFVGTLEIEKT